MSQMPELPWLPISVVGLCVFVLLLLVRQRAVTALLLAGLVACALPALNQALDTRPPTTLEGVIHIRDDTITVEDRSTLRTPWRWRLFARRNPELPVQITVRAGFMGWRWISHVTPLVKPDEFRETLEFKTETDRGDYYFRGKNLDKASQAYKDALQEDPHDIRAHIGMGRVLTEQGKLGESLKELEIAAGYRNTLSEPDILEAQGENAWRRGNKEEARKLWSKAESLLSGIPANPWLAERLKADLRK
ncbi:MAG: tetratricopeptide repeat protein [Armatimonadetes bacterium]|nr:tetratricopeptide repeat protein [Armatimonadota bacterium]